MFLAVLSYLPTHLKVKKHVVLTFTLLSSALFALFWATFTVVDAWDINNGEINKGHFGVIRMMMHRHLAAADGIISNHRLAGYDRRVLPISRRGLF